MIIGRKGARTPQPRWPAEEVVEKPDFEEYARLLRQAQTNPSYTPWNLAVRKYEHDHPELNPYFAKWQKETT